MGYLRTRGTPAGVYEFTRTLNFGLAVGDGSTAANPLGFNFPPNTQLTSTNTGVLNFAMIFTPQDLSCVNSLGAVYPSGTIALPNAAEFAALFDEIMIDKVEVTMMGSFVQVNASGTNATICPAQILIATDDNSTDSSLSVLQQMGDCQIWHANNQTTSQKTVTIKPKFNTQIYYNTLASAYKPSRGYVQSSVAVPHYALLLNMRPNYTSGQQVPNGYVNFSVKYYLKCRNLK